MNVIDILQLPQYDFLKTFTPEDSIVLFAGLGGSHAYGTNTKDSDIDVRGIFLPSKKSFFGITQEKEVLVNNETDTVFYSFIKFCKLLSQCNPNILEIIGEKKTKDFSYVGFDTFIKENLELFLSKRVFVTFKGYAISQLRRLENALARDSYPEQKKEEHILKSLDASIIDTIDRLKFYRKENYIHLYMGPSEKDELDVEIYIDLVTEKIPLRVFMNINNEMMNTLRNFGKLNHRNRKKDDNHLYKHAMHLIRLYYMLKDIALEHRIVTYREKEHDILMAIRNGEMEFDEIMNLNDQLEEESREWEKNCDLQDKPNISKINEIVANFIETHAK